MRSSRSHTRSVGLCLAAVSFIAFAGCSGSSDKWVKNRPPVYKASGKVLYKGDPVEGAAVIYHSSTGEMAARGLTDAEGKFTLSTFGEADGAIAGSHRVTVAKTTYEKVPTKYNTPEEPAFAKVPKELLPTKYLKPATTDLSAEITSAGPNEKTFELTD